MTIDKTIVEKAKRTTRMERSGHRTKLEIRDLPILNISLESPQGWKVSV